MSRNGARYRDDYETSITAGLNRQWDELADRVIRDNLDKTNEEVVALIRANGGCKDAEWIESRRPLFAQKLPILKPKLGV